MFDHTKHRLLTILIWCLLGLSTIESAAAKIIFVKSGQSIQAAINAAAPCDRIHVEPGTYAENIEINKDGIDLCGDKAILTPPANPVMNTCSNLGGPGSQAGICVVGSNIVFGEPTEHAKVTSVGRYVKGVSVSGFQISGFAQNIYVIGGLDTEIARNTLYDGDSYGVLVTGSKNTVTVANNIVSRDKLRFIGICNDNPSNAKILLNHISGYDIALCVQTPGALYEHNEVDNCCYGAFIDPGIKGAVVSYNHISALSPRCATDFQFGAGGVIINGAIKSVVNHNVIEGQRSAGPSGGIILIDDYTTPTPSIAMDNVVEHNILRNNDFDIFVNTTGSGNVVRYNQCTLPAQYCS